MDYKNYLLSPKWKSIKRQMYHKWGCCQVCGSTKNLNVHHEKGYKNLGHEKLSELKLLCKNCHFRRHRWKKGIQYIKPSDYIFWISNFIKKEYMIPKRRVNW